MAFYPRKLQLRLSIYGDDDGDLGDEHCISKAEKTVFFGNGGLVGGLDEVFAGKCHYQQE